MSSGTIVADFTALTLGEQSEASPRTWKAGAEIGIFSENSKNTKFSLAASSAGKAQGEFVGAASTGAVTAYYPYSANATLVDGVLTLTANDTQLYNSDLLAQFVDSTPFMVAQGEEGADLSVGSRYVTGVNVVNWPMGRVLMSYFASKYVRIVTGLPIHDTTAGFKCYRREVLETIELDKIKFKGYAFQIEMKFTAYQCGFKIAEVPVIFVNRELGTSKMNSSIFGEAFFGVMQLKWNSWFRKYPQKK